MRKLSNSRWRVWYGDDIERRAREYRHRSQELFQKKMKYFRQDNRRKNPTVPRHEVFMYV